MPLTFHAFACVLTQNITGVVAAISDLLCVKIPSSYQVSSTPERGPLAMLSGLRVGPHGGLDTRPPPVAFQARMDAAAVHQRPLGQMMMRPNGTSQGVMQQSQQQQQQRFQHHSPGEMHTVPRELLIERFHRGVSEG